MFLLYVAYNLISVIILVLLTLGLILLWFCHLSGIIYSLYKFHRKPSTNDSKELPGVSVLKPLTCVDANLYDNLKTFFTLCYPRYEILFCVQEPNEALIAIIEQLRAEYPNIDSQIFIASQKSIPDDKLLENNTSTTIPINDIINPKIFNMLRAYETAQYPLLLISDSGLMMNNNTLYDMAVCMGDRVGLVHQMPFTSDRKGFAASVEKVHFGTQQARMYMASNFLGIICIAGMSCLIRKECIDRAGGLRAFGQYISEDYYLAYEVAKQGWKVCVASQPALQNSGECSLSILVDRMIRWYKLRLYLNPLCYLEPIHECFSSAIFAGIVAKYLFQYNGLVVATCHILIWFFLDYIILRITQGGPLPFSKFEFAIAWLVRELASYYIYFNALKSWSTIKWRGEEYRLGSGTRVEELS